MMVQSVSCSPAEPFLHRDPTDTHIIAGLVLGYLAMVARFGYIVVLMQSGLLMRQQFFSPRRYHGALALRHQLILGGNTPPVSAPVWRQPFSFEIDGSSCLVGIRNFVVRVPLSHDPYSPIAQHLKITPAKFKFRADFSTAFDWWANECSSPDLAATEPQLDAYGLGHQIPRQVRQLGPHSGPKGG
jgi:hypothetical protein